jgi:uncharacterized lipoprotein YddW (UPF0748 family)
VALLLIVTTACSASGSAGTVVQAAKKVPVVSEIIPAQPTPTPETPIVPSGPAQYRALWVDGFHQGFKTPQQADTLIERAHRGNLNALFVQVRKRGDAYFRKGVEPVAGDLDVPGRPNFDPLSYLIQKAHTANPPLEVHAWLNTFFVGQTSEVFQLYGDRWGNLKADGGNDGYGFLDPGVPEVRAYTQEVFMQVVRRYNVDGVHMDFVRYPDGGDWGYTGISLDRFNRENRRTGRPEPNDPLWQQWRRDQVTAFVHSLHDAIAQTRPSVKLSGALIAYGVGLQNDGDWQRSRTYTDVYQDWATWFREGYLDLGIPMNYDRDSSPKQQTWFRDWTNWEKDHQGKGHLLVGVGAFLNYPEDTIAQIRAALQPTAAGNRPLGVAIYSYASTSLYGTDDFYLSPLDQGYLPRQPYAPNTDPTVLADRAARFNEWFYTALSAPSTYQDPALGKVPTTPVFLKPAPVP